MAISYLKDWVTQALGVSATIQASNAGWKTGDLITVAVTFQSNSAVTAQTISNDGGVIDWVAEAEASAALNARIVLFAGRVKQPDAPTTISVTAAAGSLLTCRKTLFVVAHRGDAGRPVDDNSFNVFSGTGGADVTQSLSASGFGSCFWFVCADGNATNTFEAAAGCELLHTYDNPSFTGAAIAPLQQPLQSGNAFTIGESETGGRVSWIAWEIGAAPDYWLMGQSML